MNWVLVLMMLAALQATDSRPDFVDVLTPPPQVSVGADNLHIVGTTSAGAVRVTLNGREQGYAVISDSIFHYHLDFGYGLNEITLTPLSADSQVVTGQSSSLEILYGPSVSRRYQRVYPEFRFHGTVPQATCIECHENLGEKTSTDTLAGVCLSCHLDVKRQFSAHTQASDSICASCHLLDRNLALEATAGAGTNPCYRCHKDKIGEYAQEFIHGPVAGGGCVICHNSHGSQYDNNLNSPQEILCFSCHEDLDKELSREYVHKPFADGDCGGCHDPHSTANKWVLVKKSEEICLNCHGEMGVLKDHGHPYNVKPKKPLQVKLELTER